MSLRVFVRGKDWQRALQVLIDLRGNGAANDVSYGAAISACESSEEWQTAIVLLTEACLVSSTPEVVFFFFHYMVPDAQCMVNILPTSTLQSYPKM